MKWNEHGKNSLLGRGENRCSSMCNNYEKAAKSMSKTDKSLLSLLESLQYVKRLFLCRGQCPPISTVIMCFAAIGLGLGVKHLPLYNGWAQALLKNWPTIGPALKISFTLISTPPQNHCIHQNFTPIDECILMRTAEISDWKEWYKKHVHVWNIWGGVVLHVPWSHSTHFSP